MQGIEIEERETPESMHPSNANDEESSEHDLKQLTRIISLSDDINVNEEEDTELEVNCFILVFPSGLLKKNILIIDYLITIIVSHLLQHTIAGFYSSLTAFNQSPEDSLSTTQNSGKYAHNKILISYDRNKYNSF